jgi:type I restriction enzyme M protein
MSEQITISMLESHLWESANILRGPVDAADFKTYIFPLLFFKRISDAWDDEYQEIVADTGDEQLAWFPESHRFQIPQGSHWNDIRATASNVGAALQRAMREIEKANPDSLYGVFGDAQWSNKERLSDALLKDLIEHFSKLPLGKSNVTSDLLGDAYEHTLCRTRYQPA